jgi:hypothetical protein
MDDVGKRGAAQSTAILRKQTLMMGDRCCKKRQKKEE